MTGSTADRVLAEGARIRRDVYSRLLLAGRADRFDGPDDPRLVDYLEFAAVAEAHGRVVGRGDSFGDRFVDSPSWRAYRDSNTMGGYAAEHVSVPVMEPDELHQAAALTWPGLRRMATDENTTLPLLSAVFDLVTVVPAAGLTVRPMGLNAAEVVGVGLPDGAASVEVTATGDDDDVPLHRQALHVNVLRRVLDDSEQARRLVNDLMRRFWLRALAHEILMGDGSTVATRKQLLGVNSKAGVGSVTATADLTLTLATAIQTVQTAGYEDAHVLVAAPLDARKFLMHAAFLAERFPTLRRVVAFNRLTAGTAFLGAYGAANLYLTTVAVNVSQAHTDNWTTGRATVQPEAYAWLDVPQAGAFCKIVSIA